MIAAVLILIGLTCIFFVMFRTIQRSVKKNPEREERRSPPPIRTQRPNPVYESELSDECNPASFDIEREIFADSIIELAQRIPDLDTITYSDLLRCVEWRYRRFKILIRDAFRCTNCGYVSRSNHVHHTYYLMNRMPWEVRNEGLVTLCKNCHVHVHETQSIPVKMLNTNGLEEPARNTCRRCGGTGYLPEFYYHENGVCFTCNGGISESRRWADLIRVTRSRNALYRNEIELIRNDFYKLLNQVTASGNT